MSVEPSGTLGLPRAGKVALAAIRAGGFEGTVTAEKELQVLGFPDKSSIEISLIPNLVRIARNEGAVLDPAKLKLTRTTDFGTMQSQIAAAPLQVATAPRKV